KEYYFYLDSTPTHSYMKFLYKYPQEEYPYARLVAGGWRSRFEPEFELLDTGIFDQNRYFDIFIEYAKADPEDIGIRITVVNRGPEAAPLVLLPTLWYRNAWSWGDSPKPAMRRNGAQSVICDERYLGVRKLFCEGADELLFTENETNFER